MLGNAASPGSCAIVVPPARFTAAMPAAPSTPVPLSTTAAQAAP